MPMLTISKIFVHLQYFAIGTLTIKLKTILLKTGFWLDIADFPYFAFPATY